MPKIKTPTFVKRLLTGPNRLAKLAPVIFVAIFAGAGIIYLVASHAATPPLVTLAGTNFGGWYKDSTVLTVNYYPTCLLSPNGQQISMPISTPGSHEYYIWQDSHYQPFLSVDTTASIHFITGVGYTCGVLLNPNTNNLTLVSATPVRIDNSPPGVNFVSANSSTYGSTVTVTGADSDPGGSGVASVRVNGVGATLSGGSFTATVPLSLGVNTLAATATDVVGFTTVSGAITVTRAVPPPAPKAPASGGSSSSSGSKSSTSKSTSSSSSSGTAPKSGSSTTTPAGGSDTASGDTTGQSSDNSDSNDVASLSQPNVPNDKSSTLTSYDNLVKVTFPRGAFGKDAYCTVDNAGSASVPVKSAKLIGPYDIACTDNDGQPLSVLKKAVSVDITMPSGTVKYTAYTSGNNQWSKAAGSTSGNDLSFKLTGIKTFAAAPPAKSSISGKAILNIVGAVVIVCILGGIGIVIHKRNKQYANYDTQA